MQSCINNVTYDPPTLPSNTNTEKSDATISLDLPGYIGIRINNLNSALTKASDPSFKDGDINEYRLVEGNENHFAIIYAQDLPYSQPLAVLPLFFDASNAEDGISGSNPNITFITKNLLTSNSALINSEINLNNSSGVAQLFSGNMIFVLLNFDKSLINFEDLTISSISETDSHTTASVLANISKEDFLNNLCVLDYKIIKKDRTNIESVYFTMSNTVYLSGNSISYNYTTTPLSDIENRIYASEKEAANGEPLASINVERLAVKYSISFTDFDEDSFILNRKFNLPFFKSFKSNNNSYTLETENKSFGIKIIGYGVNALEKKSFLIKQLKTKDYNFSLSDKYWNDEVNKRCYWAEDPNYDIPPNSQFGYPHQFRSVTGNDTIRSYQNSDGEWCLNYISFNDLTKPVQQEYFPSIYTLENTFNNSPSSLGWLWNRASYSAAPQLILGCRLISDNDAGEQKDYYRDSEGIFYDTPTDILKSKLELLKHITGFSIITKHSSAEYKFLEAGEMHLKGCEYPGGDGKVMISLSSDLEYFIVPFSNSLKIEEIDMEGAKKISHKELGEMFYRSIGSFDHFNSGYMYYVSPIPHSVTSLSNNSWKTLGEIGAVRNCWYDIRITGIKEIGNSVDVLSQKIIPALTEDSNPSISLFVDIINWEYKGSENEW